jgi:hypothetical protein
MRVRMVAVTAVGAAMALGASAAPALATKIEEPPKEFEASASGKTKIASAGLQLFRFKAFEEKPKTITVKCHSAAGSGTVTEGKSAAMKMTVTFGECESRKRSKVKASPVEIEYFSDGRFKILSELVFSLEGVIPCTIKIGAQSVNEETKKPPILFTNVALGETKDLGISTKTHLHEGEEGIEYEIGCAGEELSVSGENGVYKGTLIAELIKGSLGIS